MARIFIEGFECGSVSPPGWVANIYMGQIVDAATYDMSGQYALEVVSTDTLYRHISNVSEIYLTLKMNKCEKCYKFKIFQKSG